MPTFAVVGHIYVCSKFSCVRSSHDLRTCTHAHILEGTLSGGSSCSLLVIHYVCTLLALSLSSIIYCKHKAGYKYQVLQCNLVHVLKSCKFTCRLQAYCIIYHPVSRYLVWSSLRFVSDMSIISIIILS